MTDDRPICVPCSRKEGVIVRFRMEKNGVVTRYGSDRFRNGDLWQCPECGMAMIDGFGSPYMGKAPPEGLIVEAVDK